MTNGSPQPQASTPLWKMLLGGCLVVLLGGGLLAAFLYFKAKQVVHAVAAAAEEAGEAGPTCTKPQADALKSGKADFALSSQQLAGEYASDAAAADQKYKGKVLKVTGVVSMNLRVGDRGYLRMTGTSGSSGVDVDCHLEGDAISKWESYKLQQEATFIGLCDGKKETVRLFHCAEPPAVAPAKTPAPKPPAPKKPGGK